MKPISGISGTLKIGAVGEAGGTAIAWIGKYTFKGDRKTFTVGPHIGDANEYEVGTGLSGAFTVDGTIPEDGDAGQNALIVAFTAGTTPQMDLNATKGKKIRFAAPVYDSLEIELDGKGTHTIKASGKGAFTITQDAS